MNRQLLEKPFEPAQIRQRKGRNGMLDYVEGHSVIHRLNEALDGAWSFEIMQHEIREDEVLAQTLGIDTTRYKLLAFALSSGFAGLAGGLYAYYVQLVSPVVASAATTSLVIGMVVFGGLGTLWGPVLGALLAAAALVSLALPGVVATVRRPAGLRRSRSGRWRTTAAARVAVLLRRRSTDQSVWRATGSMARRLFVGWSVHAIRPLRRGPTATKCTEAPDDPSCPHGRRFVNSRLAILPREYFRGSRSQAAVATARAERATTPARTTGMARATERPTTSATRPMTGGPAKLAR